MLPLRIFILVERWREFLGGDGFEGVRGIHFMEKGVYAIVHVEIKKELYYQV